MVLETNVGFGAGGIVCGFSIFTGLPQPKKFDHGESAGGNPVVEQHDVELSDELD